MRHVRAVAYFFFVGFPTTSRHVGRVCVDIFLFIVLAFVYFPSYVSGRLGAHVFLA